MDHNHSHLFAVAKNPANVLYEGLPICIQEVRGATGLLFYAESALGRSANNVTAEGAARDLLETHGWRCMSIHTEQIEPKIDGRVVDPYAGEPRLEDVLGEVFGGGAEIMPGVRAFGGGGGKQGLRDLLLSMMQQEVSLAEYAETLRGIQIDLSAYREIENYNILKEAERVARMENTPDEHDKAWQAFERWHRIEGSGSDADQPWRAEMKVYYTIVGHALTLNNALLVRQLIKHAVERITWWERKSA